MEQLLFHTDIEYGIILIVLVIIFLMGMKRRNEKLPFKPFSVDKDFSSAIKGIACVMILLSHYGKRVFGFDIPLPWGISKLVFWSAANIALVWFMFFSGYGLSLKDDNKILLVGKAWLQRVWKVYGPYLVVMVVALIVYVILPERFTLEEMVQRTMPPLWHHVKHLDKEFNLSLIYNVIIHSSWYVECILWFYSFWYLSIWMSRKIKIHKTTILCILMLIYLLVAYKYYGISAAYYYRYPCVFLTGHFLVTWKDQKLGNLILGGCVIGLNLALIGKLYMLWFLVALACLFLFSLINTCYTMKEQSIVHILGAVSYYYYLSHAAICWPILCFVNVQSCIVWVVLSFFIAWFLYKLGGIVLHR